MLQIDLSKLNEEQLVALSMIDPAAVMEEKERRNAFHSMGDGLTALAQAALDLEAVVESMKQTAATRAVKDTGILTIVRSLLARARIEGIAYDKPEIRMMDHAEEK